MNNELNVDTITNSLEEAFSAHLVVPDVLGSFPTYKLNVSYRDNTSIELGNLILPENLELPATIDLNMCQKNINYTLIMTDPDVPNRAMPTEREYLHWMVTNISGNNLKSGNTMVEYEAPLPKKGSGLHRYVFILLEQSGRIFFDKTRHMQTLSKPSLERDVPNPNSKSQQVQKTTTSSIKGTIINKPSSGISKNVELRLKTSEKRVDDSTEFVRSKFNTKEFISEYSITRISASNFFQTEYNDYVGQQLENANLKSETNTPPSTGGSKGSPTIKLGKMSTTQTGKVGTTQSGKNITPTSTPQSALKMTSQTAIINMNPVESKSPLTMNTSNPNASYNTKSNSSINPNSMNPNKMNVNTMNPTSLNSNTMNPNSKNSMNQNTYSSKSVTSTNQNTMNSQTAAPGGTMEKSFDGKCINVLNSESFNLNSKNPLIGTNKSSNLILEKTISGIEDIPFVSKTANIISSTLNKTTSVNPSNTNSGSSKNSNPNVLNAAESSFNPNSNKINTNASKSTMPGNLDSKFQQQLNIETGNQGINNKGNQGPNKGAPPIFGARYN